jgi:hypothetical protein
MSKTAGEAQSFFRLIFCKTRPLSEEQKALSKDGFKWERIG